MMLASCLAAFGTSLATVPKLHALLLVSYDFVVMVGSSRMAKREVTIQRLLLLKYVFLEIRGNDKKHYLSLLKVV